MDEVITFKHQTLSHFISHCKYSLSPFTGKKWPPLPPPPQKAPQPDHPTEKPPLPIFFGGQKPPAENPPSKLSATCKETYMQQEDFNFIIIENYDDVGGFFERWLLAEVGDALACEFGGCCRYYPGVLEEEPGHFVVGVPQTVPIVHAVRTVRSWAAKEGHRLTARIHNKTPAAFEKKKE